MSVPEHRFALHEMPLDGLWTLDGAPPLHAQTIAAEALPAPARRLLDHGDTMTARLSAAHHSVLGVRVLGLRQDGTTYVRKIALEAGSRKVQIALIRLALSRFALRTRNAILAGMRPFGAILAETGTDFTSCPEHFLQIKTDAPLAQQFALADPGQPLYGRRNRIIAADGTCLAETLEVVAPV